MTVAFDTNVLVYATAPAAIAKGGRAREVITRGLRSGAAVLLLQTLAEFSHVALRKAGLPVDTVAAMVTAWQAVLPVEAAVAEDLPAALAAAKEHRIAFWDAMLWAASRRLGVRHLFSEDMQDGRDLQGVRFVNPFEPRNDALIDRILPV
jgi:predicted nucleic acid-binding protein